MAIFLKSVLAGAVALAVFALPFFAHLPFLGRHCWVSV